MSTANQRSEVTTQGHVATYGRDGRWRRAMAKSLDEVGHSYKLAAAPRDLARLLESQAFDVLLLRVRDEEEARAITSTLEGIRLPPHTILVGSVAALPPTLRLQRRGTLRYVPGPLPACEVSRLVDTCISAGVWEETGAENGEHAGIEPVDLEDLIERAASTTYAAARRKRQRFRTVVSGTATHALGSPAKLRRIFSALLRVVVALAPYGATVSVEAESVREEWRVAIRGAGRKTVRRVRADVAEELREETKTLAAVSRDIRDQGGMLWAELLGPAAFSLCLTLPAAAELRSFSA